MDGGDGGPDASHRNQGHRLGTGGFKPPAGGFSWQLELYVHSKADRQTVNLFWCDCCHQPCFYPAKPRFHVPDTGLTQGKIGGENHSAMALKDQLVAIYDRLDDLHTLIILLQSRDTKKYPLPGNADELLDECEEELNKARDELMALSQVGEEN
jgi:hypothetical protein